MFSKMNPTTTNGRRSVPAEEVNMTLPFAISDESQPKPLFVSKMRAMNPFANAMNDYHDSDLPFSRLSIASETQGTSISTSVSSHGSESFEQSSLSDACTSTASHTSTLGEVSYLTKSSNPLQHETSISFSALMDFADNTHKVNASLPIPSVDEGVHQTPSSQSYKAPQIFPTKKIVAALPFESICTTGKINKQKRLNEQRRLILPSLNSIVALDCADESTNSIEIDNTQIDANSFEVAVTINSSCTFREAMNILGNPHLLQSWCDPLQDIIVIKRSEGADNDNGQYNQQEHLQEYECEWIEAIALDIVSPSRNSGYLHNTSRSMWSFMGFPSHGKVTMLVERQRGKVGIKIGPFAGMITVSHIITLHEERGRIRIIDRVQLERDGERSYDPFGVSKCVEHCILPTIDSYMDQVSSSMIKLCCLITNREIGQRDDVVLHTINSLATPLLQQ